MRLDASGVHCTYLAYRRAFFKVSLNAVEYKLTSGTGREFW
jgi:hypothetical protein